MSVNSEQVKPTSTLGALRLRLDEVDQSFPFEPIILKPGISFVGRTADNDVVLPSHLVSRRHAKLMMTDEGLTLHDLDSHNGVFRNGEKIRIEKIHAGDRIYFGNICLFVEEISDDEMYGWLNLESGLSVRDGLSEVLSDAKDTDGEHRSNSLSVLLRAVSGILEGSLEEFMDTILNLSLELTDAQVGMIVEEKAPGEFFTHSKYWNSAQNKSGMPVHWPLIERCVAEGKVFSLDYRDADEKEPDSNDAVARDQNVLCVPVTHDSKALGAIYLGKSAKVESSLFQNLDIIAAFGHIVAYRLMSLQAEASDSAAQIETYQKNIDELQAELTQLVEQRTQERDEEVARLERELQAVEKKCQEAEAKQKDTQIQFETANQMLQSTAAEADQLIAKISDNDDEGALLQRAQSFLYPTIYDRLIKNAQDEPFQEDAQRGMRTTLCFSINGIEEIVEAEQFEFMNRYLNLFCEGVRTCVEQYGGRLEQSLGKLQCVYFEGTLDGVTKAIQCARAVQDYFSADLPVGLKTGIHMDQGVHGFFGNEGKEVMVHLGRSVTIAFGACEYSPSGRIYVTDAIKQIGLELADCVFVATGPHLIRGFHQPVNLYELSKG